MKPMPPADEPFSVIELQQATRNRGMPLEGLRYDITPTGIHYLLAHFDIPAADAASWRVEVTGNVERALSLSLDDLRARPSETLAVTLECAGNGRSRMPQRSQTQPWLLEAIGTAEWTGTSLAVVLADAGIRRDTVELVFTGADHGIQRGVEHDYARALSVADSTRPEVLLAYAMNGRPLEPQHGAPMRLLVPGWYGMTSVKWLRRIEAVTRPFDGFQQAQAYRVQRTEDDPGERVTRMGVRALMIPPGFPEFPSAHRFVDAGPVELRPSRPVQWHGRGLFCQARSPAGRRRRVGRTPLIGPRSAVSTTKASSSSTATGVYLNLSLRHELVGLQHESGLRAGTLGSTRSISIVEIANINDALSILSAAESIAVNPNEGISKPVSVTA